MVIIGITGTLGAGKGTVVDYLLKKKKFLHFSAREFISREIVRRGLPVNRDTMTAVANDLREIHGSKYIAEELYREAEKTGKKSVLESLRTVGEVEALRKHKNFYLFAVDADPKKRYERVVLRKSETDRISFERFLSDEERELKSENPSRQNLSKCIELADFVFTNNGTIEELKAQVGKVLSKILK